MKGTLLLTPRQCQNPIAVPYKIVKNLEQHHVDSVRFLYQQLIVKGRSVVLNNEFGFNEARQIGALLSVIRKTSPFLIFCQTESYPKWFYELVYICDLNVTTVDLYLKESSEVDINTFDAVLVPVDQIKQFKNILIDKWFMFIIDDIDIMLKSRVRYITTTVAKFKIGITNYNFLDKPDLNLQWSIIKWLNPKLFEDKDSFIETAKYNQLNLLQPYPEYWRRIIWRTIGKPKPNNAEIRKYESKVLAWCNQNNIDVTIVKNHIGLNRAKKRVYQKKKSNGKLSSKKRIKSIIKNEDMIEHQNSFSSDDSVNEVLPTNNSSSDDNEKTELNIKTDDVDEDDNPVLNSLFFSTDSERPANNSLCLEEIVVKPENIQVKREPNTESLNDNTDGTIFNSVCIDDTVVITQKSKQDAVEESNRILDSILYSPKPESAHSGTEDVPEESCPILDSLLL